MITWKDFYTVMSAVVPLYVAMFLAYGSVRWWRIFTPDQCSGINRFAAVFAIPLLSFHFIATNDPYAMNLRFIAADTLQKLIILSAMAIWSNISSSSTHPLDWVITIFSLSTLPNTLVMGIPLLVAMYGDYSGALMVQIVVLQCVIWYTLILFLFEYRAARLLILAQFPNGAASSIVSLKVDSDVGSLVAGEEFLQADAEVGDDGKIRVTVRKSTSSLITPRISNLTGAEIYSLNPTPRGSNFNPSDMCSSQGSVHSDRGQTQKQMTANHRHSHEAKELHMFVWSSNGSQVSDEQEAKEIRMIIPGDPQESRSVIGAEGEDRGEEGEIRSDLSSPKRNMTENNRQMPPASVMIRLILVMVWRKIIRNPNTYSSLLGLVWALVAFRWHVAMPRIMEKSISILSDAGLGMAMFSLGLFMASQPKIIACGNTAASLAMAARFVAGPAVMAVASIALGLRGTILHIAIVQAALPQGIVTFVFAKEYSLHPTILSTGVIFGMLIALPITLLYYTILGL